MILMAGVVGAGFLWHGEWRWLPLAVAGWFFMVCAGLISLIGAWQLGRHLTPFPDPRSGSQLVRTGVYGIVRHPLYCSVTLAAVGWALLQSSLPALAAAFLLAAYFDLKARYEERLLRQHFPEYTAYAARVRRLIPWIY
jgi:protein-S-isoprenylcysteine O-methyltransferase Ste14